MSNDNFRTQNRRLPLQLVLVPGGRPGRLGAHQVSAERPHHPRDVQRAGRSHLRLQGPGRRRRRRDGRRLPSRRVPLHRAELQGHAALRRCSSTRSPRWASSRTACSWFGPRPPKASVWPKPSTKLVDDVKRLGPLHWPANWQENGEPARGLARNRQRTRRGDGGAGMSDKPKGKLAIYWAASCGGCEISILAIDEKILDVAEAFDIVMWPCAADGKVRDVESMPDGEHRRLPVQRRHPHQRAGIHGPTDAAQVEGPGGLRLVRQRGLHSRPGQHEHPEGNLRRGLQGRLGHRAGESAGRSPAARRRKCPRARCTCRSSTTR